jgi:GTPase Era involved in 16S rRNA processing
MNLYQTNELAKLEVHVDKETGEIDLIAFEASQIALIEKQRAVVAWLKNNDASIAMLDNAIKQLQERKKAIQTRYDGLKSYLHSNMKANDITEINAADLTFSAKIKANPPSVLIEDEALIPKEFMTQPVAPPPAPDKNLIKAAIKSGQAVPGCKVVQGERLDIS